MKATSEFLNRPIRSEAQARADIYGEASNVIDLAEALSSQAKAEPVRPLLVGAHDAGGDAERAAMIGARESAALLIAASLIAGFWIYAAGALFQWWGWW